MDSNKSNNTTLDYYLKDASATREERKDGSSSLGEIAEKYKAELLGKQIADDFRKQQVEINKRNKEFQEKYLENFKNQYQDDIDKKTKDLEDKIENSKLSVIETLGMFIALFTFISVDFQVFKSYRDPVAISALTMILIGAIFLFIVVFDYFILQARKVRKTEENAITKKYVEDGRVSLVRKIIFCVSLVLIFLGVFMFSKTTTEEISANNNEIKKEVLTSVQTDLDNQKSELEKINKDNGVLIKDTNSSILEIKKCIKNFGFTYKCFE
ncbi:MAG: hypothetical protein UR99_C0018G0013 [Candidatus Moranbacteria bacterium GW2011_GWD2_36_12]|nr:MAG: hypothetical protein UR99_C0018G0013 [Candidatus Moranbacteria bacterium GW2011_GWD2_36_12]KKQ06223.1 MAG: hypothetical protein US16_C0021G0013 [Candidatus Moranbacteria bacterium GW2011_GWE2_36_40]